MADASISTDLADRPDEITLLVGGRVHRGWTRYNVDMALDSLAHAFELEVTERWLEDDGSESAVWTVRPGDNCQIELNGTLLFHGWIDAAQPEMDPEGRTIGLSGRAKVADLVDCAAIHSPGSWSGRGVLAIASDLCAPFGIAVRLEGDGGKAFARFALEPGESVFEALSRMAAMRGLLVWSPDGAELVLGRPAPQGTPLRLASPGAAARLAARHDISERYSSYLVKGQMAGSNRHNGKAVSQPKGEARDPGVRRHRPYLVIAEDSADAASAAARARWEASVRAARAQSVTAEFPSAMAADGTPWSLLRSVSVEQPHLHAEGGMIVSALAFSKDAESGTRTTVTLALPGAFLPEPISASANAARIKVAAS